jgi:hypothetical protein
MGIARVALLMVACAASAAHAEVDWAAGLVRASGLGVADRQAPSPAAAREPARRAAEANARKKLEGMLPALPLATGGTLKAKLTDKAVQARLARAIEAAITVESTPHTDGSWDVVLAVPLEAVRQAIVGLRPHDGAADRDPPVVIVEGVTAKPAIGYTVGGVAGATLWVVKEHVPSWAKDAPRVRASGVGNGAIAVSGKSGGPATLFVILQ